MHTYARVVLALQERATERLEALLAQRHRHGKSLVLRQGRGFTSPPAQVT
jgi:hypothetical protein